VAEQLYAAAEAGDDATVGTHLYTYLNSWLARILADTLCP
jgi:hypothetical protein